MSDQECPNCNITEGFSEFCEPHYIEWKNNAAQSEGYKDLADMKQHAKQLKAEGKCLCCEMPMTGWLLDD